MSSVWCTVQTDRCNLLVIHRVLPSWAAEAFNFHNLPQIWLSQVLLLRRFIKIIIQ